MLRRGKKQIPGKMRKYRLYKVIKDEVEANTHYEAFLEFRQRYYQGLYSPAQGDITYVHQLSLGGDSPSQKDYVNQTPRN